MAKQHRYAPFVKQKFSAVNGANRVDMGNGMKKYCSFHKLRIATPIVLGKVW